MLLLFNVIGYIKDLDLFLFKIKKNLKNSLLILIFGMKMLLNTKDQKKQLKKLNQKILNYKEILLEKKSLKIALLELISKHLFLSVETL